MLIRRPLLTALALSLLLGGAVLAEKYYVSTKNTHLMEEDDPFADSLRKLGINEVVETEDEIDFDEVSGDYVEITTTDGLTGYVKESALYDVPTSESDADAADIRETTGAEDAGAGAMGLTQEIEDDLGKRDTSFKDRVAKVSKAESFVNRRLRGADTYKEADHSVLINKLRGFMQEGGLKK